MASKVEFCDPCTGEVITPTGGEGPLDNNTTYELIYNSDGTATLVGSDGTTGTIDACQMIADGGCLPTVVNNNDGTYTFNDGQGNTSIININEIDMDINEVILSGSLITFVGTDGTQTPVDICALVAANCNSPMVVNADGSVTYTDNAGTVTIIPAPIPSVVTQVVTGQEIATHESSDGTIVSIQETITSGTNDGTQYIITHEDSSTTNIAYSLVDNGDGTFSLVDGEGNVVGTCNKGWTTVELVDNVLTVTYPDGTTNPISLPSSTIISNGDGTATHTSADGTQFTLCEVCPTLEDNADGTGTFTNADGTEIDVCLAPCPTVISNSTQIDVIPDTVNNTFTIESCLLDALCDLELTYEKTAAFTGITTTTDTFTLVPQLNPGETFVRIKCISLNGIEQDSENGSNYGVTFNGLVATTQEHMGSPTSPCFGKFTYEVVFRIKDLINCTNC